MTQNIWLATFHGEEIDVTFCATPERCDFGVPQSPVWYEPGDIEVYEVQILGVPVEYRDLPKQLQTNIDELVDEVEWPAA